MKRSGKWTVGGTKEKVADLDKLLAGDTDLDSHYFIITNVESLRNDEITSRLVQLCQTGVIGMVACDEAHRCFDYNTLVATNYGYLKIGDIVKNHICVYVKSYNEHTDQIEWKKITNWFENFVHEPLIELTISTNSGIKTIRCTRTHKIFTTNRGWVPADDLTPEDDIQEC